MTKQGTATTTVTETNQQTRRMPMYKVLIHNDDKTSMEFVVWILMNIFCHEKPKAVKVMLEVHEQGIGLAGVYPLEHAEVRRDTAVSLAKAQKYPLQFSIEPDE